MFSKFFNLKKHIKGNDNLINIAKTSNLKIKIKIKGNNNKIVISKLGDCWKNSLLNINITANNSSITIDEGFMLRQNLILNIVQVHMQFGAINNSHIQIGASSSVVSGEFSIQNSNVSISVGKECMLSRNVLLYASDGHPIYDLDTNKIINKTKGISIGNNCWIAQNTTILKNVKIFDNCIIGANSTVTKSCHDNNSILAGNPARIVKTNIRWQRGSKEFTDNI